MREEVAAATSALAAKDASFAPPRWVAWLLRPAPVIVLSIAASILLLPAGRALHRRAMDEVRPASIREALYAAVPTLTRRCVPVGRYAEVAITVAVDEDGSATASGTSVRAFTDGGEPLPANGAADIERCVVESLPRAFGAGSRPVETGVTLRMLPRAGVQR